jgi:hypothetical protein
MPYGYDPILTSFTSITTSSSNCSGEGTKRTYQGLWRMSDGGQSEHSPESCSISRSTAPTALAAGDPHYAPDALSRMDCAGRPPAGLGRPPSAFARNQVRQSSLEHLGLRGEGSSPVPLPPPARPKPCILCANLATKPICSSDFSFELRTSNRLSGLILLRMANCSPELWTLRNRYGSRNTNVSRGLGIVGKSGSATPLG